MANTNAPFGFAPIGSNNGATANMGQSIRAIAPSNSTAIFFGDAVVPVTGSATGYITRATASTVALAGVFLGCLYYSLSQRQWVNSRYWPGVTTDVDSTLPITAYVVDDPNARFRVQSDSTGITFAKVGQNAQLIAGAGNTTTGLSGMTLNSTTATTATYPFIITGLVTEPAGANGTDAGAYNVVEVGFNNMIFKTGITGIS